MQQKQITIVVGLVTNDKGEVLLAKRNQPENPQIHNKWEFPGGGIEFGEEPEQALLREIKEETGLKVEIVKLLPKVYSNIWHKAESEEDQVIIISYECKAVAGSLETTDSEIGMLQYFLPNDIDYSNSLPKVKEIVELLNL